MHYLTKTHPPADGAQPSAFVVDALLSRNASALGERMPNSVLLQFAPGAAVGEPAAVSFVSAAEAAFAADLWSVESTVTTTAAGTAADGPHYWYPLRDTRTVRLSGSVPLAVAATLPTIRIASLDPSARAEALLAAALTEAVAPAGRHAVIRPAGHVHRPPAAVIQAYQAQCASVRAGSTKPTEGAEIVSDTLLAILNHTLQESDNTCKTRDLHLNFVFLDFCGLIADRGGLYRCRGHLPCAGPALEGFRRELRDCTRSCGYCARHSQREPIRLCASRWERAKPAQSDNSDSSGAAALGYGWRWRRRRRQHEVDCCGCCVLAAAVATRWTLWHAVRAFRWHRTAGRAPGKDGKRPATHNESPRVLFSLTLAAD